MNSKGGFWGMTLQTEGCWLWQGSKDAAGYGQLRIDNKLYRAHRYSYIIHYGEIPDGLQVMHKCDNPSCVNPEHLSIGTHQENALDVSYKGRRYNAQLTPEIVREIREKYKKGASQTELRKTYKLSGPHIHAITRSKIWKWV